MGYGGEDHEVQPVDGYVRGLLAMAADEYGVEIDVESPTRSQRIAAALAIKGEANGFYSSEIMVGRRISSDDPNDMVYHMLIMARTPDEMDERFFDGFAHTYYPEV